MPIDVACPVCNKKYRVPDALAGKAAKCQECGSVMRVPANGPVAAAPAAPAKPAAASTSAKPATAGPSAAAKPTAAKPIAAKPAPAKPAPPKAADPFGLGDLGAKEELFDTAPVQRAGFDPLGDPLVQDFGFAVPGEVYEAPVDAGAVAGYSENPVVAEQRRLAEEQRKRWGGASDNPYMREAEAALGGPKKGGSTSVQEDNDAHTSLDGVVQVIAAVLTVLGAIAIGAAAFSPGVGVILAVIVFGLGGLTSSVGQIWALVMAFIHSKDEIWKAILYLVCGPYQLFYWYENWRVMKTPVSLMFTSVIAFILGWIALVVAGARAASAEAIAT